MNAVELSAGAARFPSHVPASTSGHFSQAHLLLWRPLNLALESGSREAQWRQCPWGDIRLARVRASYHRTRLLTGLAVR